MKLSPANHEAIMMLAATGSGYLTAAQGTEIANLSLISADGAKPSPTNPEAFYCVLTDKGLEYVTSEAANAEAEAPVAPAAFGSAPVAPVAPVTAPVFAPPVAFSAPVAPVAPVVLTSADVVTIDAATVAPVVADVVLGAVRSDIALPPIKRGGGKKFNSGEYVDKYSLGELEIGQSRHISAGSDINKTSRTVSTEVSKANANSKVVAQPLEVVTVTKYRYKTNENGDYIKNEKGKKVRESFQVDEQKTVQTKFFVTRKVDSTDPEGRGIRVFRVSEDQA